MTEQYIPTTVVALKEKIKKVMITGYLPMAEDNKAITWRDYYA